MIGQSISNYKIIEKLGEARPSWLGCSPRFDFGEAGQAETGLARDIKVIL